MSDSDKVAAQVFRLSTLALMAVAGFGWGMAATRNNAFPVPQITWLGQTVRELLGESDDLLHRTGVVDEKAVAAPLPDAVAPGLLLVAGSMDGTRNSFVRVIDRAGAVVHEWDAGWSRVWPDPGSAFDGAALPNEAGLYIHGLDVLPDGGFVANFEHLSTFRMDACGEVVWKLPNFGHHAVHVTDTGAIWATAETQITEGPTGHPNIRAPFRDWTLQRIGDDGEVEREIGVVEVLEANGLTGLLHLANVSNGSTAVSGDTLHLNDVDVFPRGWASDTFAPGDIMISLRNINAILVFDPETLALKFLSQGRVLRHHDPDFLPDGTISVFDNHNLEPDIGPAEGRSRIVELSVPDGAATTVLGAEGAPAFYTAIMGTHQRLQNGNILVNSSGQGRVLEFTPEGELAWRWSNLEDDGDNGRTYVAMVLPPEMDRDFWAERTASCPAAPTTN